MKDEKLDSGKLGSVSQFDKASVLIRDPIGFHAATYHDVKGNRIAIVFEGTKDLKNLEDWATNFAPDIQ
ncbi:MAG: hypothetical protein FD126_2655 [Elusimicrobia bacterium]|nr:MAG: hypothetical protein FD126_2655 [Elusimicrobiota bacterium]